MTARVLQIVDIFDALTTERPYKRALSAAEALTIMEDEVKRGWWDRDLFQQFQLEIKISPAKEVNGGRSVTACA